MRKFNIIIIKIKDCIIPGIFLIFTISLVLYSNTNLNAAKAGLSLWANSVIPSLFPFFVATELLSKTEIPNILGRMLNNIMKPIFNVKGEGAFALIMGIISGYPVGAKIASNFRKNNTLSKEECERLLSFTNNSGPLFIVGTVGISMFGSSTIGFLLLITHILSALTVGFLFRFWKKNKVEKVNIGTKEKYKKKEKVNFSSLGEVLADSIKNATSTILMIGGFVVIFSVIISIVKTTKIINLISNLCMPVCSMLKIPESFVSPLIVGMLEITNRNICHCISTDKSDFNEHNFNCILAGHRRDFNIVAGLEHNC